MAPKPDKPEGVQVARVVAPRRAPAPAVEASEQDPVTQRREVADDSAVGLAAAPTQGSAPAEGGTPNVPIGADQITDEVVAATGERVRKARVKPSTTAAASTTPPKPGEEPVEDGLPENQWTQAYRTLKAEIDANPNLQGPLANGILALLALAAKYMRYADIIPGKFLSRIEESPELQKKKFTDDELKKVVNAKKDSDREKKATEAVANLKEQDGSPADIEKASIKYACHALWGIESGIEDTDTLAAKLRHSTKDVNGQTVPYFRTASLTELQRNGMPFGTVLIFTPKWSEAKKIVAVAMGNDTGNSTKYQYFDPEKGAVQTFDLKDENSPIKSDVGLLAAFVPKFSSDPTYFAKHKDELAEQVDDTEGGRIARAKKLAAELKNAVTDEVKLAGESLQLHADGVKLEIDGVSNEILTVLSAFLDTPGKQLSPEQTADLRTMVDDYLAATEGAIGIYGDYKKQLEDQIKKATEDATKAKNEAQAKTDKSDASASDKEALAAAIRAEEEVKAKAPKKLEPVTEYLTKLNADQARLKGYQEKLKPRS